MQADHDAGAPWFNAQRAAAGAHAMEEAGRDVRALMPWLASPGSTDAGKNEGNTP